MALAEVSRQVRAIYDVSVNAFLRNAPGYFAHASLGRVLIGGFAKGGRGRSQGRPRRDKAGGLVRARFAANAVAAWVRGPPARAKLDPRDSLLGR